MKRMLFIIRVTLLAIISYSSIANVVASQYDVGLYNSITVVDSVVCDTVVFVYDTVVWDDTIVVDNGSDASFSALGKSSSSLYGNKKFDYTTPEGGVFTFTVNPDGVSVTLEKGYANNMEVLTIPNGVESLGSFFFVSAINDFAFKTPTVFAQNSGKARPMDGVRKLVLSDGIEHAGQNCFENAKDLEMVVIPSSLKNISYFMFGNCAKLKSVYIPIESELHEIEDFAFANCTSLDSFYIPAAVTDIKQGPWRNCKSLSELRIADDNYNFNVYDGVLYSGDRKHLIQYPSGKDGKEYDVMFGTQSIDNSAFYGNEFISKVSFPASLDSISHIAFYGCQSLSDVTFSDKIETIGSSAFAECSKLRTIQLYGNPKYTDDGENDPYNSFMPYTKVVITKNVPALKIKGRNGGILERVWFTTSQLPYFQTMEITNNEDYGFPKYLGNGKAAVYGNADPKEDVLKILEVIPDKMLFYEDVDDKGRIARFYIDNSKKKSQTLYFRGGIGGNDLVVAIFDGGDKRKIKEMINKLNNRN